MKISDIPYYTPFLAQHNKSSGSAVFEVRKLSASDSGKCCLVELTTATHGIAANRSVSWRLVDELNEEWEFLDYISHNKVIATYQN